MYVGVNRKRDIFFLDRGFSHILYTVVNLI